MDRHQGDVLRLPKKLAPARRTPTSGATLRSKRSQVSPRRRRSRREEVEGQRFLILELVYGELGASEARSKQLSGAS